MVIIKLDFGPTQKVITKELIEDMINWVPRRFRLCDFDKALKPPKELGDWQEDWNLIFPFKETFVPSFQEMCPSVDHMPFTSKRTAYYTFLKNVSDSDIEAVQDWLKTIEGYVALRDCLAISFAIDYDRVGGSPDNERTHIGNLRERAKTYGKPATKDTYAAAAGLIESCVQTLRSLTCYDSATCIVAIPPSDPEKPFDLPQYLADGISKRLGKPDKTVNYRGPGRDQKNPQAPRFVACETQSPTKGQCSTFRILHRLLGPPWCDSFTYRRLRLYTVPNLTF